MKNNEFNVKKITEDEIIIEEERTSKNPLVIFFFKYGRLLYLALMFLSVSTFLIGFGLTLNNIGNSMVPEESKTGVVMEIDGGSGVNMNNGVPITDDFAKKSFNKKYQSTNFDKGVVLVTKTKIIEGGTITYYSDKSVLIRYDDGRYVRVLPVNGDYGIDDNNNIKEGAVASTLTAELKKYGDASILYFSDGTAEITKNGLTLFVRDSKDISVNVSEFIKTITSGVTIIEETVVKGNTTITYYGNDVMKVEKDGKVYVVRNKEDINIDNDGNVTFPHHNEATILTTVNLTDGTVINFYDDGSAEIIKDNHSIMVRKSGHIVYNNSYVIEIVEQDKAWFVTGKKTKDGKDVNIFDDGSAVIVDGDDKIYVDDCSKIKYDEEGNIKDVSGTSPVVNEKTLPNGDKVTNFENGKSLVEPKDGDSYIIDTDDLEFDENGNIDDNDDDGLLDTKSVTITNNTDSKLVFRLVIEETSDYAKYNTKRLIPDYIRYITNSNGYVSNPAKLNANIWPLNSTLEGGSSIQNNTYTLIEGTLEVRETVNINLGLWISYEDITNEYQASGFIGTIKLYTESIT